MSMPLHHHDDNDCCRGATDGCSLLPHWCSGCPEQITFILKLKRVEAFCVKIKPYFVILL